MKISIAQAAAYARAAGFSGGNLVTILAIAMAESGLDTTVVNSIGATGILQIYLKAHPDVTRAQAMDPAFSFRYAYRLSDGGKNFCPWQSYDKTICGRDWDNRYKQFIPQVQAALGTSAGTAPPVTTMLAATSDNLKKAYTLSSNESVADFLAGADDALSVTNPFDIDTSSIQDTIVGITFTDPVKWLNALGNNIISDMIAIAIRTIFILLGIYILFRVLDHFLHITEAAQNIAQTVGKAALL